MKWWHSTSSKKIIFKMTISTRKIEMCMVFWNRKGVLLVNFLAGGETINSENYCEMALRQLRPAIQKKRGGKLR